MREHKVLTMRTLDPLSLTAALDTMSGDGWILVTGYAVVDGASTIPTHHFVFRRRVKVEPAQVETPTTGSAVKPPPPPVDRDHARRRR